MKLIRAGVCHPGGACSKMNHSDKVFFFLTKSFPSAPDPEVGQEEKKIDVKWLTRSKSPSYVFTHVCNQPGLLPQSGSKIEKMT